MQAQVGFGDGLDDLSLATPMGEGFVGEIAARRGARDSAGFAHLARPR